MVDTSPERLVALVDDLLRLPAETEWVEFKLGKTDAERNPGKGPPSKPSNPTQSSTVGTALNEPKGDLCWSRRFRRIMP
jgi:hypothetical protein